MAPFSCIFRNSFPWLATMGFFLAFTQSSSFGFLTIFITSSALILCPVVACRSKSSVTEESSSISSENFSSEENFLQEKICQKEENNDLLLSSSDALSDSESIDDEQTSSSEEYSENDWIFKENVGRSSTECSDGSISDEESLIEIALPTGHYVDSSKGKDQKSWYEIQQKCSFRQQTWMEMLNEMNEENMIEIDLCMGSIKCSRFEIEA